MPPWVPSARGISLWFTDFLCHCSELVSSLPCLQCCWSASSLVVGCSAIFQFGSVVVGVYAGQLGEVVYCRSVVTVDVVYI